eukprot:2241561-Rhodomonas_salina.5
MERRVRRQPAQQLLHLLLAAPRASVPDTLGRQSEERKDLVDKRAPLHVLRARRHGGEHVCLPEAEVHRMSEAGAAAHVQRERGDATLT